MSRYVDRAASFLNGIPVFLADAVDPCNPFAQFLAAKGARIQAAPDASTCYVIAHRPLAALPPHQRDIAQAVLASGRVSFLTAERVRDCLTTAVLARERAARLARELDRAPPSLPAFVGF